MANYLDMDYVLTCIPLYTFPVVSVLLCALLVYAFGFKSPPQPPSFDSIELSKKSTKKRKIKETKTKSSHNEKSDDNKKNKASNSVSPGKKKGTQEKQVAAAEKSNNSHKIGAAEEKAANTEKKGKKAAKKARIEQKLLEEKKRASVIVDDENDDGWVQTVSKKARKNRKKEDVDLIENYSNVKVQALKTKELKAEKHQILDLTKKAEVLDSTLLPANSAKQLAPREENVKKILSSYTNLDGEKTEVETEKDFTKKISDEEHSKENLEPNECKVDKELLKSGEGDDLEDKKDAKKKKKKKKKDSEVIQDESPVVKVLPEIPTAMDKVPTELNNPSNPNVVIDNTPIPENVADVKCSNVAFDELEDMFPDPKEQRRKKRVRRDH